jgi:hypothetical protein
MLLGYVNHFIAPGPYHDLFATLFVMVAWPVVTWVLRFCVKHELWIFLV